MAEGVALMAALARGAYEGLRAFAIVNARDRYELGSWPDGGMEAQDQVGDAP